MAPKLIVHVITAEVYPDEVDFKAPGPLTLALLGADRIDPDDGMVSGIPSRLLAERVQGTVPLYVAAETFKLGDTEKVGKGLESIAAELVQGYVTDSRVVQSRLRLTNLNGRPQIRITRRVKYSRFPNNVPTANNVTE